MTDAFCRFIVGDALTEMRKLPARSVHQVVTSPPYWAKRSYTEDNDEREIGREPTPAAYLSHLLEVTDELWRVLRVEGTIWFLIGDTAAFSGGSGGDYNPGGLRDGQARYEGTASRARYATSASRNAPGMPLPKSVCWLPELFGASLAYGRNLLTGEPCRQWVTRPPVTWCKPNPSVGEIIDKCREATELFVWAAKTSAPGGYYFDLDALRSRHKIDPDGLPDFTQRKRAHPSRGPGGDQRGFMMHHGNREGAPPLNWWEIPTQGFAGAHYAVMPEEVARRAIVLGCPVGGTVLDPFGGSGTVGMVAHGNGRSSILLDLDPRNAELARSRIGMFLTVEGDDEPRPVTDAPASLLQGGSMGQSPGGGTGDGENSA